MKPIRIYTNFKVVRGPFGGANSFMRSVIEELEHRKFHFVTNLKAKYEVAFINALSNAVTQTEIEYLKQERAVPVIHRKVGYTVSGGPEMREKVQGVPRGERIQLAFDPYIDLTVFQSEWSKREFLNAGFSGDSVVIRNGVASKIFTPQYPRRWFRSDRGRREAWQSGDKFRIAISSWSTDANKGFSEYERLDQELEFHPEYEVWFFGRTPSSVRFKHIREFGPLSHPELANRLRECHAILTLSRNETCSNSLIEAISCGLPAIYLNSGSNAELAGPYGVEYQGDFWKSFDALRQKYDDLFRKLMEPPFPIEHVADQYEAIFRRILQ